MTGSPVDATTALVRQAWCEVLGVPQVGTRTWEESGGDSLASLNLLLVLERALRTKLSLDLIQPDMTAVQLAGALAPSPSPASAAASALPTVFLFPGMLGDDSRLAAFRRSFAGRLAFELLEHPNVLAPRMLLTDMAAIGRRGAVAIQDRQPVGPICLAGYSFGGGVAFEAARRLQAEGRQVAFLGLIDAPLDATAPSAWQGPRRTALRLLAHPDAGRRALFNVIGLFGRRWTMAASRRLLRNHCYTAIRHWRPAPVHVLALLVASEQFGSGLVDRWRRLCPSLRVVPLPTAHETVFEPAFLDALTPAFEQALRAAVDATTGQCDARR